MNPYFFLFVVEPLPGNMMGAHASRAVVQLWVMSSDIHEARGTALELFASDLWEVKEEKEAYLASSEQLGALAAESASNYRKAQSEGIHATYNYWHRSE